MPKLNTQHQKTYGKVLDLIGAWEKALDRDGITGEKRERILFQYYETAYLQVEKEVLADKSRRTGEVLDWQDVKDHPVLVSLRKRYPQYAAKFAEALQE